MNLKVHEIHLEAKTESTETVMQEEKCEKRKSKGRK